MHEMKKEKPIRMFVRVNGAILAVILVFVMIAGMTTYFSVTMSSISVGNILDKTDLNKLYLYFFSFENHYYTENDPEINDIPLARTGFQLATNIKINDIRTFFERELPGFSEFNTKIQVAGKGTNLATLPVESSPPMNEIVKDRQISQDAQKEEKSTDRETSAQGSPKKVVYIYHSHSWESFLPLLNQVSSPNDATSSNNAVNVVEVGSMLADHLETKGIGAEHSTINAAENLQKIGWTSLNAYQYSRGLVTEAMAGEPDLKFMIDIHRDSLRKDLTTISIHNQSYARLAFIVGEANPNFKQNLELAKELHAAVEKKYPGLSRGVFSKDKSTGNGVYNQDLSPRALLIEVGGVDNNLDDLRNSMEAFANVFSEFYWKTKGASQF